MGTSCSDHGNAFPSWASGWSYFRAEVDDDYARYFFSPDRDTWVVQRKDGAQLVFGIPLDDTTDRSGLEKIDYPVSGSNNSSTYRWELVRTFDPHGNVVVYKWAALGSDASDQPTDATAALLGPLGTVPKTRPAMWVAPLSRFRDLLPSRHGRPA